MKTTIDIPDEFSEEFNKYRDKISELLLIGISQMKIEEALLLYKKGLVTFGRGAELAGISRVEMARQAYARGIEPLWSEEMVLEELG